MKPTATQITKQISGLGFEARAFAALFEYREQLDIASLWRCRGARMDGYLITNNGETILLEMKESLSWGATQAAGFQFLSGRRLLELDASRGILVFGKYSGEWKKTRPNAAWGQFALEVACVEQHIKMGALMVAKDGAIHTFDRQSKDFTLI